MKLHILKPSVNNMGVRVLVRAGGIDCEEVDAWGHTREPEFLAKCPAHLTPMLESDELPGGAMWESCAIMKYLADSRGLSQFYPTDPKARARQDTAMYYHTGSLYPMVARAAYPVLGFPPYPGEVAASDADDAAKAAARKASEEALPEMLEAINTYFLKGSDFIGGAGPSIADMRLSSTMEFLTVTESGLPGWADAYKGRVESSLGDAYAEPAADVRGYIDYVKSQAG